MDFGVVLQTTPPSARVVDLAKRAETYGFRYVWTFDSHILWQEPYVIYSKILDETRNVIVGPMVTNPATRDWTVTASVYATLNEMYGNRTVCGIGRGDSAVRVTNGAPTTLATLRESIHVIRELANGRPVEYKGSELRLPWASTSALEVWVAAYGPKALALTGEVGDGFILQLADLSIAEWTIGAVKAAAEAAGRDPGSITICVAAPAYVTDGTEAGLAARVLAEARRDMQARVARIRRGLQRRADVREDVGYLRTAFQGTALESEAQAALQALFPNNPR